MRHHRWRLATLLGMIGVPAIVSLATWAGQADSGPDAERQRAIAEAARQYARAIAGDDETSPGFNRLFQTAIDAAAKFQAQKRLLPGRGAVIVSTPADSRVVSPFAKPRQASQAKILERRSIFTDPTWNENEKKRRDQALRDDPGRIFGGKEVKSAKLLDCVAVQGAACICTGTLIGPNVVITAGHCDDGGCVDKIFIGNDVNQPGRSVKVK